MTQKTPEELVALDILRGISIIMHSYPGHSFRGAFRHASWCEGKNKGDGARALDLLRKAKEELCANGAPAFNLTTCEGVVKALRHLVPPQPLQVLKNDDPLRL